MAGINTIPASTQLNEEARKAPGSHLGLLLTPNRHTSLLNVMYTKPQSVTTTQISPTYSTPSRDSPSTILQAVSGLTFGSYLLSQQVDKDVSEVVCEDVDKQVHHINTTTSQKLDSARNNALRGQSRRVSYSDTFSKSDTVPRAQSEDKNHSSLDSLESQILLNDTVDVSGELPHENSESKLSKDTFSTLSDTPKYPYTSYRDKQGTKSSTMFIKPRSHHSSVGSNFSVDVDSLLTHSRCSSCDGCSADDTCSMVHSQRLVCDCDRDAPDGLPCSLPRLPVSGSAIHHMTGVEYARSEKTHPDGGILTNPWTCDHHKHQTECTGSSTSNSVQEDISEQKRITKSQQKSLACLIQAVFILTKRNQALSVQLHRQQLDIRKLQCEQMLLSKTSCSLEKETLSDNGTESDVFRNVSRTHVKQQKRMHICIFVLVVLYLTNIPTIRGRLIAIIKYFGNLEAAKKINRTRKMIADNWRNIPSLLTDFWRIFIFRSRSRLNANCLH